MTPLDSRTAAILQANDQFYRALSLADPAAMQRLWVNSPDAVCRHPGSAPLYGWDAIQAGWRSIFAHQGPLRIWATEVQARVFGQTADVHCVENIDAGRVAGAGILQTYATNIFRLVDGEWKLLEHFAAPAYTGPQRLEPFSAN